ncbi:Crp/Fnr family transcriptional regulator [Streptomyces sp. SPB074]|uniref:Crp/Fnr family transcriptional regulator n=1 Tax=Streptomyces sp. (strain SPB074) TaxID=465543 RepID=UPI00017FED3B|nr:Crp/Fnr family transcriptional regulator [Streptomyces sp. SPB074]EDY45098.1 cyclic nucleotide-binding domain-containing protein [Streptomyces sp. SPB074]
MEPLCNAEQRLAGALQEAARRGTIRGTRFHVGRREHVYNLGQPDAHIYLIESGQVKTLTHTRDGKQCLLSIHGPGDVFGECSLLAANHTETAQAMQVTTLVQVRVGQIMKDCDPLLHEALISHMANRLLEQQQMIANLVTMDSEHRLAALLVNLGKKVGKRREHTALIRDRITQEELAEMVGTTRSRVGYFLKRFSLAGVVHRTEDAHLCIHITELTDYLENSSLSAGL